MIELANDSFGYVPTKRAFAEGAYEPTNALIEPGGGEKIVELRCGCLGSSKHDLASAVNREVFFP